MSLFPFILGVRTASVLVSIAGLAIVIYLLVPLLRHVQWRLFARVVVGLLAGTPVGIWLLVRVDERILMLSLGAFILLYLAYDLVIRTRANRRLPAALGYLFGFLGGAFGGAFNTSGPPVVAYLSTTDLDKQAAKATILAYLTLGTIYKIGFLVVNRLITERILLYAAVLLAPSFAGMFAGKLLFERISSTVFQRAVQAVLLVLSVLMIVKALRG